MVAEGDKETYQPRTIMEDILKKRRVIESIPDLTLKDEEIVFLVRAGKHRVYYWCDNGQWYTT